MVTFEQIKKSIDSMNWDAVEDEIRRNVKDNNPIIFDADFEGLDGKQYNICINKNLEYELQTLGWTAYGKYDQSGYSPQAKHQELDIEYWINKLGETIIKVKPGEFRYYFDLYKTKKDFDENTGVPGELKYKSVEDAKADVDKLLKDNYAIALVDFIDKEEVFFETRATSPQHKIIYFDPDDYDKKADGEAVATKEWYFDDIQTAIKYREQLAKLWDIEIDDILIFTVDHPNVNYTITYQDPEQPGGYMKTWEFEDWDAADKFRKELAEQQGEDKPEAIMINVGTSTYDPGVIPEEARAVGLTRYRGEPAVGDVIIWWEKDVAYRATVFHGEEIDLNQLAQAVLEFEGYWDLLERKYPKSTIFFKDEDDNLWIKSDNPGNPKATKKGEKFELGDSTWFIGQLVEDYETGEMGYIDSYNEMDEMIYIIYTNEELWMKQRGEPVGYNVNRLRHVDKKYEDEYKTDDLPTEFTIVYSTDEAQAHLKSKGGQIYTQVDTEGDVMYQRGWHLVNRTGVYAIAPENPGNPGNDDPKPFFIVGFPTYKRELDSAEAEWDEMPPELQQTYATAEEANKIAKSVVASGKMYSASVWRRDTGKNIEFIPHPETEQNITARDCQGVLLEVGDIVHPIYKMGIGFSGDYLKMTEPLTIERIIEKDGHKRLYFNEIPDYHGSFPADQFRRKYKRDGRRRKKSAECKDEISQIKNALGQILIAYTYINKPDMLKQELEKVKPHIYAAEKDGVLDAKWTKILINKIEEAILEVDKSVPRDGFPFHLSARGRAKMSTIKNTLYNMTLDKFAECTKK